MILNKYIDWIKLWDEEVYLDETDFLIEDELHQTKKDELIELLNRFESNLNLSLDFDECFIEIINKDLIHFIFSFTEYGGQNESDTQGWYVGYQFIFQQENGGDLNLIDITYEQG